LWFTPADMVGVFCAVYLSRLSIYCYEY